MNINKTNIGLLLGDPSGIGPELTVKLLDSDVSEKANILVCLLYTSPSPRDVNRSRMPSSA